MTLDEMIEILEDCRNVMGGETEVRMMTQPSWPFEYSISNICTSSQINGVEDNDDQDVIDDPVVYIVEGNQLGYGSKRAWYEY
jgi:hypothetical protein